jgi:hypothetical protein
MVLACRRVSRGFRHHEAHGRAVKQTMERTQPPEATEAGARVIPDCVVVRLVSRANPDDATSGPAVAAFRHSWGSC